MLYQRPELLVKLIREERAREMSELHLATAAAAFRGPAGLRARLAAGLARAALVLHREAASGAGLRSRAFSVLACERDGRDTVAGGRP